MKTTAEQLLDAIQADLYDPTLRFAYADLLAESDQPREELRQRCRGWLNQINRDDSDEVRLQYADWLDSFRLPHPSPGSAWACVGLIRSQTGVYATLPDQKAKAELLCRYFGYPVDWLDRGMLVRWEGSAADFATFHLIDDASKLIRHVVLTDWNGTSSIPHPDAREKYPFLRRIEVPRRVTVFDMSNELIYEFLMDHFGDIEVGFHDRIGNRSVGSVEVSGVYINRIAYEITVESADLIQAGDPISLDGNGRAVRSGGFSRQVVGTAVQRSAGLGDRILVRLT